MLYSFHYDMRQPEYDLGKPARLSASTLLISAGTSSDHSRTHAALLLLRRPERFHCFPRTWRLPFEPRDVPGNCLFEIPRERGIVCHLAEVVVETSPFGYCSRQWIPKVRAVFSCSDRGVYLVLCGGC